MQHTSLNNSKKSSLIVRVFRIMRIVLHTLYGAFISIFILPRVSNRRRDIIIGRWSKSLLEVMNIKVMAFGHIPNFGLTGTMFVANHISWVDIHALNSIRTVRFIAKSEVRDWPVFGWLAIKANTLFINRTKKQDTGRIVEIATESLQAGDCLCYFPEGTTTDGTELKVFKGSIMQAALNVGKPVWPFTVRYPNRDGSLNTNMAYFGDMTLMESMWLILSEKSPVVELEFLAPISTKGHDRRSLTLAARHAISDRLNLKN